MGRMPVNREFEIDRELVGQRIRDRRKVLAVRQEDLAGALEVDQATVSRWESGESPMSIDDLGRVANHLKKHIAWFLRPREPSEALAELAPAAPHVTPVTKKRKAAPRPSQTPQARKDTGTK